MQRAERVFVEDDGFDERHNLEHLVLGASKPLAETRDDEDVVDEIVGDTEKSALERDYRIRWPRYRTEQDTCHKADSLPWNLVVRYCYWQKILVPDWN